MEQQTASNRPHRTRRTCANIPATSKCCACGSGEAAEALAVERHRRSCDIGGCLCGDGHTSPREPWRPLSERRPRIHSRETSTRALTSSRQIRWGPYFWTSLLSHSAPTGSDQEITGARRFSQWRDRDGSSWPSKETAHLLLNPTPGAAIENVAWAPLDSSTPATR